MIFRRTPTGFKLFAAFEILFDLCQIQRTKVLSIITQGS